MIFNQGKELRPFRSWDGGTDRESLWRRISNAFQSVQYSSYDCSILNGFLKTTFIDRSELKLNLYGCYNPLNICGCSVRNLPAFAKIAYFSTFGLRSFVLGYPKQFPQAASPGKNYPLSSKIISHKNFAWTPYVL